MKHTHAKNIIASLISGLAISAACSASASTLQTGRPLQVHGALTDTVVVELVSAKSTFALDTSVGPLGNIEGATGALNQAGIFLSADRRATGVWGPHNLPVYAIDRQSSSALTIGFEQTSGQLTHFDWAPQDTIGWFDAAGDGTASFLEMTKLSMDVANKQVLGNVVANRYGNDVSAPISSFGFNNIALFTFDTVTGVERLPADQQWLQESEASLNAHGYIVTDKFSINAGPVLYSREITGSVIYSGLRLTSQGLDVMRNTFNVSEENMALVQAANGSANGLGTLTNTFTVSVSAVPEPGTYGLMGLGLMGMVLVRQRARKATASV